MKRTNIFKLDCGCKEGVCTCDPQRVNPTYFCTDCPQTKKPTSTNKVLKFLEQSNAIEGVYGADALLESYNAWEFIIKEKELTLANIKKTHKILMKNEELSPDEKGYFRKRAVFIGGREGTAWHQLSVTMLYWLTYVNERTHNWKTLHIRYEQIHPFIDGNGRIGRIFMNWQRVKTGLPILIIEEANKGNYYRWFK